MKMDDYLLCNNQSLLDSALGALKASPSIVIDCEGKELGQQGGTLSLISLRTTSPAPCKTFLVDAVSLDDSALRPLFDLLESYEPSKIVFDGRMDFSELYHGHQVTLRGVLDLQLADITSRSLRGEDEEDRLERLSPYLHRRNVAMQPNSYAHVQRLCGLGACQEEHGVEFSKEGRMYHDMWLKRPLPDKYLLYAARDAYAIGLLFEYFTKENYINDRLEDQSERYITLWKNERPESPDRFKNNPLLPLGILDASSTRFTKPCKFCHRDFPSNCYSKAGWRLTAKRQCLVCRALSVKENHERQWAYSWDPDGGYELEEDPNESFDWDSD